MTALDRGDITELFVTNVLGGILGRHNPNGGTVQRLLITSAPFRTPRVLASTTIGSGFPARTDPNALVIGPTGVGPRPQRHPVRRRHAAEQDRRHPRRRVPAQR